MGKANFFCPISQTAHKYLYETVNKIFKAVPDLGGLINITYGERGTTCLSSVSSTSQYQMARLIVPAVHIKNHGKYCTPLCLLWNRVCTMPHPMLN